MKDYKKAILGILKKRKDSGDRFESQVLKLTLKQMDGARDDGWGVFYSKNGKSLVSAKKSIEGSYAVKDDTEEIGDNAFWGCAFLRNVAVPNTVERIGDEAFAHCISLESVCIPSFVEKIGKNPFVDLDSKVVHNQSEAFTIEGKNLSIIPNYADFKQAYFKKYSYNKNIYLGRYFFCVKSLFLLFKIIKIITL